MGAKQVSGRLGMGSGRAPRVLLFLFGACLPFVVSGPHVVQQIWAAPSILFGLVLVAIAVIGSGVNLRHLLLLAMVVVFVLTSVWRHPPASYLISALALTVVLLPLTLCRLSVTGGRILLAGFTAGFVVTVILLWIEIASQLLGLRGIYHAVTGLFIGSEQIERPHNFFVSYFRPYAAMPEPSHLGMYLAFAYAIYDQSAQKKVGRWKALCALSILATGSIAAILLLVFYLFVRKLDDSRQLLTKGLKGRISVFGVARWTIAACVLLALIYTWERQLIEFGSAVYGRLVILYSVLSEGVLTGSEGSRINAFVALPEFWAQHGIEGVLFGTGYGNYQEWLIQNYGHLGTLSSFAKGHVNNRIVVLLLSTGVLGFIAYVSFVCTVFYVFRQHRNIPVISLFVLSHFASGALLAYAEWHVLLVLLVVASMKPTASPDVIRSFASRNPKLLRQAGQDILV